MDVSIIIINYNSSHYTANCVKSIFEQTKDISFEIIIVDNNSTVDNINALKALNKTYEFQLILSKTNLGFGGGNHLGYQFAKGNYLAFINNDTIFIDNSLLKLFNYAEQHDDIGVLGPQQIDEDHKPFKYAYRQFTGLKYHLFNLPKPQKYYSKKHGNLDTPFEVDQVSGAFMFFKTDAYEAVNGFDPNIFLFYEEMDICKRLKNAGYSTVFFPNTTFIHLMGKSSGSIQIKREFLVSYLYMIQKNYSYWYYVSLRTLLLLKFGIKSIFKPKRYFPLFILVLKGGNSLTYSIKFS